jgi:hypothetical protein
MVWRGSEPDPTEDPAASDVLEAYEAAVGARMPTVDCYLAGVEAWRRAHPDQAATYARKHAVAVILASKAKFLMQVE